MRSFMMYADTETTGLDENACGIWQIAGIVEVDGKEAERFDYKFAPMLEERIDPVALEMSIFDSEKAMRGQEYTSAQGFQAFMDMMDRHVSKFEPSEKFTLCGYNVDFDDKFMRAWFRKHAEKWYGSYISPYKLDVYTLTALLKAYGKLDIPKLKLENVANHLGIEIDAHDAMSDIIVTRDIGKIILDKIATLPGTLLDWKKENDSKHT